MMAGKVIHHTLPIHISADSDSLLWKYQCIDTMKTSRDRARNWQESKDLHNSITKQVTLIKSLGANCIAIDTPYDAEFKEYLTAWVSASRKEHLKIWFRGNFSGWEGWFDYPHTLTSEKLLRDTAIFIQANADLFEDGDIFTPAPEGENGGEFNQVEIDEYPAFRSFLSNEYIIAKHSFEKIGKKVEVNWLSMNGGLARRMLDQETINATGNLVTIDHYIKTAPEMSDYINYFYTKFGAKVVIGEFGAPIPDINGSMTEDEQAKFIDSLFFELYKHRDKVEGINYWVLYDSSTAIIHPDGSHLKAAAVVKKYFMPLRITGIIKDTSNEPLADAQVKETTYGQVTKTDSNGEFSFIIPRTDTTLSIQKPDYTTFTTPVPATLSTPLTLTLPKTNPTLWDNIKNIFKR